MSILDEEQAHYLGELRSLILEGPVLQRPISNMEEIPFAGNPRDAASIRWDLNGMAFDARVGSIPREAGDGEVVAAFEHAAGLLIKMSALARAGNASAAYHLARLSHLSLHLTDAACECRGEALEATRGFTRNCEAFPVMIGRHEQIRVPSYIQAMLEKFQIGRNPGVRHSGFSYFDEDGNNAIPNRWVSRLMYALFVLNGEAAQALSPAEGPSWVSAGLKLGPIILPLPEGEIALRFDNAWSALEWATGDKPESITELVEASEGFRPKIPGTGPRSSWPVERHRVHAMLARAWTAHFKPEPKSFIPPPPEKRQPGKTPAWTLSGPAESGEKGKTS